MYKNNPIVFVLASVLVSTTLYAQDENNELSDPEWIEEANRVIVYKPENKKYLLKSENLYNQSSKFDLYHPNTDVKSPVVILIHGGPVPNTLKTKPKDWGFFTSYGQAIAKSGFAAITFNHSLHKLTSFPESHREIDALISHIRVNSSELNVDKDNIILWFFSGSGALMAPFFNEQPKFIKGIIGFYPLLNLTPYKDNLFQVNAHDILNRYTPEQTLSSGLSIPIFIARAELDSKDINDAIDSFVEKADSVGVNVILHNNTKGRHGFDNDLGESEADTIKIIRSAIEFIGKQT